jgi:hypothetical protein
MKGAFELIRKHDDEEFDLRPAPGHRHPIPTDQVKLSQDIYETKNILKLLEDSRLLGRHLPGESSRRARSGAYGEFLNRVTETAHTGCVDDIVETGLATDAITQIRADILRRFGRRLAYRYLGFLAMWGLGGAAIGLLVAVSARFWTADPLWRRVGHYGWVIVGAMAGAWFAVAVRRWSISFAEIPDYLDVRVEPFVRLLFVAVVASFLALFLDLQVISLSVGQLNLRDFVGADSGAGDAGDVRSALIALFLGLIAGMSERVVSKRLMDQVGKILPGT